MSKKRTTKKPDLTGDLMWIPLHELVVDKNVNTRPVNMARVRIIVEEFDPDVLGTIHVNEREDGTFSVLDGQTRLQALRDMGWDDQEVPCNVLRHLTIQQEAHVFKELNVSRSKPNPVAIYEAELTAQDPTALEIQQVVEELGLKVASHPAGGTIQAITAVKVVHRAGGPGLLRKTLDAINRGWVEKTHFNGELIKGVAYFFLTYPEAKVNRLAKVMPRSTSTEIVSKARAAREANGANVPANIVGVLVRMYNARLREDGTTVRLDPFVPVRGKKGPAGGLSRSSADPEQDRKIRKQQEKMRPRKRTTKHKKK